MRDWNEAEEALTRLEQEKFVAYLWGIETRFIEGRWVMAEGFVAYLWGIETPSLERRYRLLTPFVAYLWGIETEKRHR